MRTWPILFIILVITAFFWQFLLKGLLPIPSDTIVGLYHPFRDSYAQEYPRGIPFKNFLITDPVRQQIPWKTLTIDLEKRLELPLWNPYSFSGTPLLANFQSGAFYPLNILFFIFPLHLSWSLLIILGPLLSSLFMFLYLRNLKLNPIAPLFGSVAFSFSGFSMAWLEWGTITHTVLWLPLILLSIDKILTKKTKIWGIVLTLSLIFSFFAGHIQFFSYLFLVAVSYFVAKWWFVYKKNPKLLLKFVLPFAVFVLLTSAQWLPTIQFILESGREIDQVEWQREGFFLPWQNLAQFFAPDFFGNPATLNYWGAFNYGEFIGYVGMPALPMAFFALFFRRDKKTLFLGTLFFLSLIFSLPTIFAKIPYLMDIPYLSSSQPTRLLFIADFSLAILGALGLDHFIRSRKGVIFPVMFVASALAILWVTTLFGNSMFPNLLKENLAVSQRNLILPTILFLISVALIFLPLITKHKKATIVACSFLLVVLVSDLFRFGLKFNPFTEKEYLFPQSNTLSFINSDKGIFRVMTDDSRILAPNFSIMYKIQSVDGYDPLFLRRYAEIIAASERGEPNINPPFGFNRIITPHKFESEIIDFLGVKYVLSLKDLESPKLEEVFSEGETRVYRNKEAYPRAFFVTNLVFVSGKQDEINKVFAENLRETAVLEKALLGQESVAGEFTLGNAKITSYEENTIIIETENEGIGFLVLVETFYPTWKASIDGKETKIYRTNFNFRGIVVPQGKHKIEFTNSLL